MFSSYFKTLLSFGVSIFLASFTYGQCSVQIHATVQPGGDCNGVTVDLTAQGDANLPVLSNDFNLGVAGPGWQSTGGAQFSQPCGSGVDGTPYYWASTSTGTPQLTTVGFDVSCGGFISFDMVYSTQGGAAPCEGPDLPDEGVTLQYSTNGGATWNVIQYWPPNGGFDPAMTNWSNYTIPIPAGATTTNTQFQWIQTNSSGTCCDNWGIDNVVISAAVGCAAFEYDWAHVAGAPNNASQTVTATSTTTYTVTYTDGTTSCTDSYTVVVPQGPTADAGPDLVYCPISGPLTIGASPVSPNNGATYTWTGGAGSGTISGTNNGQGTVAPTTTTTYTVSVTDFGCTSTDAMTVTIDQAPTASNPAPITVQCAADVPAPNVVVVNDEADDITANPTVTHVGDVSNGNSCPEIITRTYRVTDGCGNTTDVTQTITIDDTQNPVFAAPPANITVQCPGDVPAMTNLGWTDNCDGSGSVAGVDGPLVGGACGGTITRTWTYTDACGNVGTTTQTITVDDTTLPTASNPATTIVVQGNPIPPVDITVVTDEADNCTAAPAVTFVSETSDGGFCPEIITRVYRITDDCGNFIEVEHLLEVSDAIDPTATNPPNINVQCVADVPAPNPNVVTDEADNSGVPPTVAFVSEVSDGNSCPETITRTYSVTDDCGNSIDVTQLVIVDDTQAPVFDAPPANITVQCSGDVPAMTNLGWTDNCDGSGSVAGVDGPLVGGACGGTITRTWTYTDACGNVGTTTQTITVDDSQSPVFAAPPANVTVECIGDVPAMTDLNWTDNCDGSGTVTGVDGPLVGGTCGGTITRTWTHTDACGNVGTTTQTITVHDTQNPVLAASPANVTVECIGDVPPMTNLSWTDNCDGAGSVSGTDGPLVGGACGGTITRTWTYTDACGNSATSTQIITVDDTTVPTASNPATTNVLQGDPLPPVDVTVVIDEQDNCTVNPTVTFVSETSDGNSCPETVTRVYRITDDCGNFIEVDHLIVISDGAPPTASNPTDINISCFADLPAPDPTVVTDEDDNSVIPPVVAFVSDVSDGNSCPETITRTYSVTDDCGNSINVFQLIIINDLQAPVFDAPPADVTVECTGDIPAMTSLGWTDNCDGTGTVLGVDGPIVGGNCGGTVTRTWIYTDACGNTSSTTQTITINDTQNPVFAAAPANVTVECTGDVPAMTSLGWTDNCDGSGTVTGTDGPLVGGTCGGTITRTWTYTDACGNVSSTTQTITINDTQNPVFDAPPANITVECIGDVPAMTNLGWTDNCDGSGTVAGTDGPLVGGTCGGTITRTWTYTDVCGNIGSSTQTITVNDTQAPVFDPAPADITVECIGDVPAMTNLDWTDNCDGSGTVSGTDGALVGGACGGTITRTWTHTDVCGNTATSTQIITVDDTTPPTASNPATTNVLQGDPIPPVDITVVIDEQDNCTLNPAVTFISETSDGNSCPETITRVYRITDDCGNFIEVDHLIIVNDVTNPTASNPPDINVSCFVDVPAPDPTVVTDEDDNSVIPPVVAFVSDVSDGNSCPETITRTYSVTDDCGNSINVTQLIIITPTAAPIVPADQTTTVECIADAVQPIPPTVVDECGNNIVPAVVVGPDPTCEGNKVFTFTYTDCAGNSSVYTYTYVIDLITPPTVPANGSEQVVCVEDIYTPTAPTVTDLCGNNIVPVMTESADPVCMGDKVFTFTYTDCAGNSSVYTYTFTINDTIPPTASNPAPIAVPGSMNVPAPDPSVVIDEADNCVGPITVAWVNDVSDGKVCAGEIITRTYSVTDACGNQIFVTQDITILATYPPIDAGADTIVCVGDWAIVNADNPWGVPISWDNGIFDGTPWQPTTTTIYTVTADNLGCISTDDMLVTMEDLPVVNFTADLLGGCAPIEINFANNSTTISSFDNCQWTVNGNPIAGDCSGANYTFDAGGLYDIGLTTTSVNGCTNSVVYDEFIFVENVPQAAFSVSSSIVESIDTEIEFYNNSIDAATYQWTFDDNTSSTSENPTHVFPEEPSGSYNVQLVAYSPDYGCTDTTHLAVEVEEILIFYVPNSFTPDGDIYNQTFEPVFHSGFDPFDYELLIFNRWGEVIFESHDASVGWDGSYGVGRTGLVQDGTYTWRIEFKTKYTDERKIVTGSVNLIR